MSAVTFYASTRARARNVAKRFGDRVRFKDKPYLSDGNILSMPQHGFVGLDKEMPYIDSTSYVEPDSVK